MPYRNLVRRVWIGSRPRVAPRARALVAGAAALTGCASGAWAQVTLLTSPGSPNGALPFAINNNGRAVGQVETASPGGRDAAYWTGSAPTVLPLLPGAPPGGDQGATALDVNANGVIVGLSKWPVAGPGGSFAARPARWENGVATDLGVIPGFTLAQARAINTAGEIAGNGFNTSAGSATVAVRWSAAGVRSQLDRLPTHTSSLAFGINSAGRIVGYSGIEDGDLVAERRPVAWDGTNVVDLGLPMGFNQGAARSINDSGTIAGLSMFLDQDIFDYTGARATRWSGGTAQLLPLLSGFEASAAVSVNSGGLIIGALYADVNSAIFGLDGVPVLWSGSTVTDLRPLLAPSFPADSTFTLTDISDRGQITGWATTPAGDVGFVLTVPAPSAGALMVAGVLARRRRR